MFRFELGLAVAGAGDLGRAVACLCLEGKMSGAVLVAIAASIGNLLQGWDNATIAGKSRQIGFTGMFLTLVESVS